MGNRKTSKNTLPHKFPVTQRVSDDRATRRPLFEQLASERAREHAALVRLLESDVFQNLMGSWRETLRAFGTPPLDAPRAGTAVGKVAGRLIAKRYRKAVTSGGHINDDSPDELLHALRIDCKKLRYLLEFFASLYAPDEIGALVKQLKRLQDNLGEFNDLSVQRAELRSFLKKHNRSLSVETGAAIGTLIANLDIRQRDVRRRFKTAFASFVAHKTGARFEKLFVPCSGRVLWSPSLCAGPCRAPVPSRKSATRRWQATGPAEPFAGSAPGGLFGLTYGL